jgi:hypothetical protein
MERGRKRKRKIKKERKKQREVVNCSLDRDKIDR